MPRSHSLPNQIWRTGEDEEGNKVEEWQFVFQRDFPAEIQSFIQARSGKSKPVKLADNMHKRGP